MAKFGTFTNESLFTLSKETTKDWKFFNLKDLFMRDDPGKIFPVKAILFNKKSKYGKSCFVASDGFFISLPSHCVSIMETICADEEAVKQINDGHAGIKIRTYLDDKGVEHYSIITVDT